jgi:hypothetical protein
MNSQRSSNRFRWVEIWLSILLPAVLAKQIGTKKHAQKLIGIIKESENYKNDDTNRSRGRSSSMKPMTNSGTPIETMSIKTYSLDFSPRLGCIGASITYATN